MDASAAILKDPGNEKAIFRRALAENKLGLSRRANMDLKQCIALNSQNDEAKKIQNTIKKADQEIIDVTVFVKPEAIQSERPLHEVLIF